jgi:hypothetical protein
MALLGQPDPLYAYRSCGSLKSCRLVPGHYRFWVRAIGSGGPDNSPATYGFRIVEAHKSAHTARTARSPL